MVNWAERVAWGSGSRPRHDSLYLTDKADNAKAGREFHDSFRFNRGTQQKPEWIVVKLFDCVCVNTNEESPDIGDEFCRVLELWEDTKGRNKGDMTMLIRWFFLPKHLSDNHPERTRERKSVVDAKQVFEHCNEEAHKDRPPVASVRRLARVLCLWQDERNHPPPLGPLDAAAYDWWFNSGWDTFRGAVVPLEKCVDSKGAHHSKLTLSSPALHRQRLLDGRGSPLSAYSDALCFPNFIASAQPDKRYPCLRSVEICHTADDFTALSVPARTAPSIAASAPSQRKRVSPPVESLKRVESKPAAPNEKGRKPKDLANEVEDAPPPKKMHVSKSKRDGLDFSAATESLPVAPVKSLPNAAAHLSHAPLVSAVAIALDEAPTAGVPPASSRLQPGAAVPEPAALTQALPPRMQQPKSCEKTKAAGAPVEPPAPQASIRFSTLIPKKSGAAAPADAGAYAALGASVDDNNQQMAAQQRAQVSIDSTATLAHWQRSVRPGQSVTVLHVEGLPPCMDAADWKAALVSAKIVPKFTALGGWMLPDGSWRGNGSAYLLMDRSAATEVRTQLHGAVMKVAHAPAMRPLTCAACDLQSLVPAYPPAPLPGHYHLPGQAREGVASATARGNTGEVVPHFVQANTLELDFSLQWRALMAQHKLATEMMTERHANELEAEIHKPRH